MDVQMRQVANLQFFRPKAVSPSAEKQALLQPLQDGWDCF